MSPTGYMVCDQHGPIDGPYGTITDASASEDARQPGAIVWKPGDAESTARVATQIGVTVARLDAMAAHFFAFIPGDNPP